MGRTYEHIGIKCFRRVKSLTNMLSLTQALKLPEQQQQKKMCGRKFPQWAFFTGLQKRVSLCSRPGKVGRDFDLWALNDEIFSGQILSRFADERTHSTTWVYEVRSTLQV